MKMETYQEKLDALFDKWKKETGLSDKNFSPDGIVNPDVWFDEANKPRILFALKETNKQCDLCKYVIGTKDGGKHVKWQTWYNVTRWTYLLRHLYDQSFDEMWKDVRQVNERRRVLNLERVVLVNVKKSPGGKSTSTQDLKEAFGKQNKVYLPREIALFGHLDYVVCCGRGVASCISQTLGGLVWDTPKGSLHRCARTSEGTLVVDFVHPQSRVNKKELFRRLYDAVKCACPAQS